MYTWLLKFQEIFTQASHDLFIATKRRIFFKNITIVIPKVGSILLVFLCIYHCGSMFVYLPTPHISYDER